MDTSRANRPVQNKKPKEYSSLPLAATLSSVILLSAAGGWLLLAGDTPDPIDDDNDAIVLAIATEKTAIEAAEINFDSELRKARLAANADILVSPPEQSALYYYARVMAAEPQNSVVNAEFETVLARLSMIVTSHLAKSEFDSAHELADLVGRQIPDHALVKETREALNDYADQLLEKAIQHARDGNDDEAAVTLEIAEGLPGLNSVRFAAVRDSVDEIQQSRVAAERDSLEEANLAADKDVNEWTDKVRAAIGSGQLITPEGDSARDYLAERDTPVELKERLTSDLKEALMTAAQQMVDMGDLVSAESYLNTAIDLSVEFDGLSEFRDSLENKIIEAESNRVFGLSDFVQLNIAPARYPLRANRANITGWVEVLFTVTSTGATSDIEIVKSEPENVFENSAVEAVEQWTFQPREYRGQPIDQRTAARVVFELE